jgi:rare lipoprotein A (peptidoglycan hydrolase)
MVRYEQSAAVATTPTTAPPTTTTTTVPTTPTTSPVTAAPQQTANVQEASVPVTTTTVAPKATPVTAPPPPRSGNSEQGQATWYAAAPPGKCASPTLPFGTVLTVTDIATGATVICTVDDREEAGYPRVVDMSPSGFAQLADPSQGVVDVTISW